MKAQDIVDKVLSGEFKIDTNGHKIPYLMGRIREKHEHNVSNAAGANDGGWSNSDADTDEKMREYHQKHLDQEVAIGEKIGQALPDDVRCSCCANKAAWFSFTGDGINLNIKFSPDNNGNFFVEDNTPCQWSTPKSFKGEINIDSKVVMSNYFNLGDSKKEDKYAEEWSLCKTQGRFNIANYKLKNQNTAYGQMGNMSVTVFLAKDKKEILIGEEYYYNTETEEECTHPCFDGFDNIGEISLEVWRYELTTQKTLDNNPNFKKEILEDQDVVEFEGEEGVWEFEQFYGLVKR